MTPLVSSAGLRYALWASPASCVSQAPRYLLERAQAREPLAAHTPIDAQTPLGAAALRGAWLANSQPLFKAGLVVFGSLAIAGAVSPLLGLAPAAPALLPPLWVVGARLHAACEAAVITCRYGAMQATARGDGLMQLAWLATLGAVLVCCDLPVRLPWHGMWATAGLMLIAGGAGLGTAYALALRWHALGAALETV